MFEMLTGRRAFDGSTPAETLGAILHKTPDWSLLPADTPSSIRALLRRCLVRDRAQRLDSANAARIEIDEESSGSGPGPHAITGRRSRSWMWVVAGAAVVAAAAAIATLWPTERSVEPAAELRVDIATPLATDPYSFAVSPDGRKIVYVGAGAKAPLQLWMRVFDRDAPVVVPDTEGAVNPLWSPDSASIAFFSNGKLRRVDLNGGEATTLADAGAGRGGSWSTQGQILFAQTASGPISMVGATGSQVRAVTTLAAGDGGHLSPVWHPDGRRFLFFVQSGDPARRGTYLSTLDSPDRTRVVAADGTAEFRGANEIVYVDEGTLYSQRFDPASNAVSGERVRIATGISTPLGRSAFSLSRSGPIAYRSGRSLGSQLRWLGRNGEDLGAYADPDDDYRSGAELSPGRDRVAMTRRASTNNDIWIFDRDGGARTRVTSNPAQEVFPVWTPDGRAIVFRSSRGSTADIYMTRTDGDGDGTRILEASTVGSVQISPTNISRDGRWLLFFGTAKTGRDIWAYPMDRPGEKPRAITSGPADESNAVFSPDGRWIAYQTNESGRFEIAVRAFANTDRMWQVSNGGGLHPRWSQDGKELYYVAPSGWLMAVAVSFSDTAFRTSPAVALFAPRFSDAVGANPFVAPYDVDRGRFLVSVAAHDLAAVPITMLFNWSGK
jgi:Tol biopolymer transport system component